MNLTRALSVVYHVTVLAVLLLATLGSARSAYSKFREKIIDQLLQDYDGKSPPSYIDDQPVTSKVQVYILSIDSMSSATMDFSMSFFLRQRWVDPRLQYDSENNITRIELDTRIMSQIWVPDLYVVNEKDAAVHDVTVPNKLMHLYPNGLVVYSLRVSGTFSCYMDLIKYPLDTQICNVTMESYGLSTNTMLFRWNSPAIRVSPKLHLPQFNLTGIHEFVCDVQYDSVNFTCIGLTMHFARNYGYYMIQVYIPSILIVMLSWVSFYLNIDATPARISLGLLTVLTMTTQSSGARAELPRVSYVKAIDVWMATCLFFVFAALIEFAYVNVLSRVEQRRLATVKDMPELIHNGENSRKTRKFSFFSSESRRRARTVDKISRVVFPAVFILFNILYWFVYLMYEPVKD